MSIETGSVVKNIKSGMLYEIVNICNMKVGDDWLPAFTYKRHDHPYIKTLFVRDMLSFAAKFEEVKENDN
jgi:hypothetical protein